jgi:hypothetical protein
MQNKKTEKWSRLTGPLEELADLYEEKYLKTIGPMGALTFIKAADALTDQLLEKKKWLADYYASKARRSRKDVK